MMRLNRIGVGLAAIGLALAAGCVFPSDSYRAEEPYILSLPFEGVDALSIDWRNGEITVTIDAEVTEITATGTTFATAATQATANDALTSITVDVAADDTDATLANLTFDAPTGGAISYGAHVELTIPAGVELTIASANGDITVTGNEGTTTVQLANGDVTVNTSTGDTTINLANGTATVADHTGDADVEVANGTVVVSSTEGNVEANVANGSIQIQAQPAEDGTVLAQLTTGSISVEIPADFGAALELTATVGTIDATLDDFTVTDQETGLYQLTATLNGGGGQITANAAVGDVQFGSLE